MMQQIDDVIRSQDLEAVTDADLLKNIKKQVKQNLLSEFNARAVGDEEQRQVYASKIAASVKKRFEDITQL